GGGGERAGGGGWSRKRERGLSRARSGMSAVRVSQPPPRVSRPPGGAGDSGHDAGQRPPSPLVWPPLEFRRSGREAPHMRITAAVLYDVNKPYSIETVELDPPKRGEVLAKIRAAGVRR